MTAAVDVILTAAGLVFLAFALSWIAVKVYRFFNPWS